jgi:hypothetical protein
MHFGCYNLSKIQEDPSLLYTIGKNADNPEGVLTEIAEAIGYQLPKSTDYPVAFKTPTSAHLTEMISIVSPSKELGKNIAFARELLGEDAMARCADWLERSGAMRPINGAFCDPTVAAPRQFDTVVWSGGIANWMERRLALTKRIDPDSVGQVLLPVGNRQLALSEHQQVRTFAQHNAGRRPTEQEYVDQFVYPALKLAGFGVIKPIPVDSGDSEDILDELFKVHSELLEPDHQTLVVGNAPNLIQAAGQIRAAGHRIDKSYDYRGSQLFMRGDTFPIARNGELAADAQNPITGMLGQGLRNFKILLESATA